MAASAIILHPHFAPINPLQIHLQFSLTVKQTYNSENTISPMAKTIFFLLLTALFIQHFAECSSRGASSVEIMQRQLLLEMKKLALKKPVPSPSTSEMPEDWQLRRVPSGPDPLHHNGQDPKKPRTP